MIRHVTHARGVTEPSRHALRSRSAGQDKTRSVRQDKTRRDYLLTYILTNYRACFSLFYSNIILANIRSNRMKPRDVWSRLRWFYLNRHDSVVGSAAMQMYADWLYFAQKGKSVSLSALHFWANTLQAVNILLFSKWNQRACCHPLTWDQHFNLFRPEIAAFDLTRCV